MNWYINSCFGETGIERLGSKFKASVAISNIVQVKKERGKEIREGKG